MAQSVVKQCTYFGTHPDSAVRLQVKESRLLIGMPGNERGEFFLPLLGEFNRMNAVAAISVLHTLCINYLLFYRMSILYFCQKVECNNLTNLMSCCYRLCTHPRCTSRRFMFVVENFYGKINHSLRLWW